MANVGNVYLGVNGQAVDLYSAKKMYVGFNNKAVEIPLGQSKFDYKTWLASASLSATGYANLDAVLADEVAVRKLMTIHASVDYLAGWKTTDEDIVKILSNDICAKWITLRDYALDTLDREYRSLMESLGKYYYGEWALMPQVPKMTSNTAPYGEAFASSEASSYPAYNAFDGNASTYWRPSAVVPCSVGYQSTDPICVKRVKITHHTITQLGIREIEHGKIQGSNDGTNWVDISADFSAPADSTQGSSYYVDCGANNAYYSYHRVYASEARSSDNYVWIADVQFYAWAPKGNVPIMTSNTAPYGTAIYSSEYNTTKYNAYRAFNGICADTNMNNTWSPNMSESNSYIGYKFTNPINAKKMFVSFVYHESSNVTKHFIIQSSNDGSNWSNIKYFDLYFESKTGNNFYDYSIDFENDDYYLYYRLICTDVLYVGGAQIEVVNTLQFYGREMKVSVPVMTSNTAPYGEAIASTENLPSFSAWQAFDENIDDSWGSSNAERSPIYSWIGYDFKKPVVCKLISFTPRTNENSKWYFQGSNDKQNWVNITEEKTYSAGSSYVEQASNDIAYRYYRGRGVIITTGRNNNMFKLQFYGFDYSEYDWDADNPRHYLYDHGVEVEQIYTYAAGGSKAEKWTDSLYIYSVSGQQSGCWAQVSINGTYKLVRCTIGDIEDGNAIRIIGEANPSAFTNIAERKFAGFRNELPYNFYVDVSNISSGYPSLHGEGNNRATTMTEFWLE